MHVYPFPQLCNEPWCTPEGDVPFIAWQTCSALTARVRCNRFLTQCVKISVLILKQTFLVRAVEKAEPTDEHMNF